MYILCGNKSDAYDANDEDHVSSNAAEQLAASNDAFVTIRCSSKDFCETNRRCGNIDKVFKKAVKLEMLKQEMLGNEWLCTKFCTLI